MNDGSREIDAEIRAEAAAEQAAFSLPCPECGKLVKGSHSDLDIHLRDECEADGWPSYLDDLFGSDEEDAAA